MSSFSYIPWDNHWPITGTYDWHMTKSPFAPDPGVDYGLPFRTPIYTVFEEQWVQETQVDPHDGLGPRKIVVMDERINGQPSGRVFQIWHCDEIVINRQVVKKGVLCAYSGHSGAASNHGHCVLKLNGKKVDPTPYIEETYAMNLAQEKQYQDNIRDLTKQLTEKNDNYVTTLKSLSEVSADRDYVKAELDAANVKIQALNAELTRVKSEPPAKTNTKPLPPVPTQTPSSVLDIIYSLIRKK